MELIVAPTPDALAQQAAERFIAAANAAVAARGRARIALSGGSTPEKMYGLLAGPKHQGQLDWSKVDLFLGDERFVPADDPRSNYGLARRVLLASPEIAPQVYPVDTSLPSPADAARAYCQTLATAFEIPADGPPPRFDLVLLGLGDDGHTASLFPGKAALGETRAWVTSSTPGRLPPPVDRITLTFPTINAAREALFLAAGAGKAEMLSMVLEGSKSADEFPAVGVRPEHGSVVWLVDAAAAARLTRS